MPDEPETFNDLIRKRSRMFPKVPEPSSKPEGSADGGEGEAERAVYEETPQGRMRVWAPAELNDKKERNE